MGEANDSILVTSHVGRDLLQSAGVFKHERLVVWEYVSNGLEYVDPGTSPIVRVRIDGRDKRIVVADNGRGMTWDGLQNFFVMHGENIDRQQGRPGRGVFGTGKSAAFGIAGLLRVSTVRNGQRSRVELRRADIEAMKSGDPVAVTTIEKEVPTDQCSGTLVEIEDIYLKKIDQAAIIRYIERHIARWPNATVFVNNHQCEFAEPPVGNEYHFRPEPGPLKDALGDVKLTIKVSKALLGDDLQGIAIFSNGVWYETTLAGSERKEMVQYIFGEIDVPRLVEDKSPIPAFDMSRSMQLNRSNELVQKVFAFIGVSVEKVRRELVEKDKERKVSEEAKKLAREASEIARIINEDFDAFRSRLAKVRAMTTGSSDLYNEHLPTIETGEGLIFGDEEPAEEISETGGIGHGEGIKQGGTEPPNLGPEVKPAGPDAEPKGKEGKASEQRKQSRGGFSVEFREMGESEARAKYERDERTLYINLDHPQLKAALGLRGVEDIAFKRLAYEVAFAEYAIALAYEMDGAGYYMETFEPIMDVRETLNRITRVAAHLYAA